MIVGRCPAITGVLAHDPGHVPVTQAVRSRYLRVSPFSRVLITITRASGGSDAWCRPLAPDIPASYLSDAP